MAIDNFSALTLSVYNNKGVFALLLGSGVSLEAKIMSGWKVTEDLIKKVAVIQGDIIPGNAYAWYKDKFGCEAEYSNLLEQLGKKPSELESLLRPYFEPSEEDEYNSIDDEDEYAEDDLSDLTILNEDQLEDSE